MIRQKNKVYTNQDVTIRLELDKYGYAGLNEGDIQSSVVEILDPDGNSTSKVGTKSGTDIVIDMGRDEITVAGKWKFQPWVTMVNGNVVPGRTVEIMIYEKFA